MGEKGQPQAARGNQGVRWEGEESSGIGVAFFQRLFPLVSLSGVLPVLSRWDAEVYPDTRVNMHTRLLGQARLLSVRTRGCSGEPLQDVRVEEAPTHPAAPAPRAGAVDRWLAYLRKNKARISADVQGIPESPSLPAISSGSANRPGRKKRAFHLTPSPNVPSL